MASATDPVLPPATAAVKVATSAQPSPITTLQDGFSGGGFEMREIRLPRSLFQNSAGVGFDIGGSRCKVAFVKKPLDEDDEDGKVTVVLAAFPNKRFDDALAFVKQNAPPVDARQPTTAVRVTGLWIGTRRLAVVESDLNAKVMRQDEFVPSANAVRHLIRCEPQDEIFYSTSEWVHEEQRKFISQLTKMAATLSTAEPTNNEEGAIDTSSSVAEAASSSDKTTTTVETVDCCDLVGGDNDVHSSAAEADVVDYPYLILCVGSGVSAMKVDKNGKRTYMGGTPDGGVCMLSLAKLLVGTDNYDEFMELASRGNEANVCSAVGDRVADLDEGGFYSTMTDVLLYSFGKVIDNKYNGSREDLARALVHHTTFNISTHAVWMATAEACRTVYTFGGFFEHPLARDKFESHFTMAFTLLNKPNIKLKIFKQNTFLPALGTLFDE